MSTQESGRCPSHPTPTRPIQYRWKSSWLAVPVPYPYRTRTVPMYPMYRTHVPSVPYPVPYPCTQCTVPCTVHMYPKTVSRYSALLSRYSGLRFLGTCVRYIGYMGTVHWVHGYGTMWVHGYGRLGTWMRYRYGTGYGTGTVRVVVSASPPPNVVFACVKVVQLFHLSFGSSGS